MDEHTLQPRIREWLVGHFFLVGIEFDAFRKHHIIGWSIDHCLIFWRVLVDFLVFFPAALTHDSKAAYREYGYKSYQSFHLIEGVV